MQTLRSAIATALIVSSLFGSLIAAGLANYQVVTKASEYFTRGWYLHFTEASLLLLIFALIVYCNTIYFATSLGFERLRKHRESPVNVEGIYSEPVGDNLLIVVPSYKEEWHVVFQTVMSAGLVEYPQRTVALLIDDPPSGGTATDDARLVAMRSLPDYMQSLFDEARQSLAQARATYLKGPNGSKAEHLAILYEKAARWLERQAEEFCQRTEPLAHTDRLFIDKTLRDPASAHKQRAAELRHSPLSAARILQESARLDALFDVCFISFERKRYVNLSHASNKAMNLNSYFALLGQTCREVAWPDGLHIEPVAAAQATMRFPDPEFIVSIDADSLITSNYALRLVGVMRQPGSERLAIAQCPYTATPNPPGVLERTAAASTDVQFFSHHGMSHFGATFWVGAAALMRRAALEEIATEREERGYRVKVFIYDRILIEDAAATVDLLNHGWGIYHDLARLSYSATPPDFGALIIQRRRWANGGLLILPKLLRYASRWPWSWTRVRESAIRLPTLISSAMSGACLPLLLLVPFDDSLFSLWIPVAGLFYYPLYGRDLLRSGYRLADLPRVYALNLLLIPILLGGTLQSLRQACTGKPIPFRRTPKITHRTSAPPVYLIVPAAALLYAAIIALWDAAVGEYCHLVFSVFNGAMVGYAIRRFIGVSEWRDDMLAYSKGLREYWAEGLASTGADHETPYIAQKRPA